VTTVEAAVPVEQVTELLVALSRARRWLSRLAGDRPAALGSSGVSALAEIVRSGPLRLGELAARERITPPTLTRIVAGLVEHGYVQRTPDPDDARAYLVAATPDGHVLLRGLHSRRTAELSARLGRLSADDRDALLAAAPALGRLLEDEG
jgi:DNA-binding MarR family transcriptional regulator